jgi:hypothetical protein
MAGVGRAAGAAGAVAVPGMNPYIERAAVGNDFRDSFIPPASAHAAWAAQVFHPEPAPPAAP